MPIWKSALNDYAEVFDFYYTDDEAFSNQYFSPMPEGIPTVRIIDTNKPTPVEKSRAEKVLQQDPDTNAEKKAVYPFKTIIPLLPNQISELVPKMIEKFIDGELRHYYE